MNRRVVLKVMAALAGTIAASVRGQAKAPKAALKYQDSPKNGERCSACVHFVSGGQCKIVEGQISPDGWCTAYTPKR